MEGYIDNASHCMLFMNWVQCLVYKPEFSLADFFWRTQHKHFIWLKYTELVGKKEISWLLYLVGDS